VLCFTPTFESNKLVEECRPLRQPKTYRFVLNNDSAHLNGVVAIPLTLGVFWRCLLFTAGRSSNWISGGSYWISSQGSPTTQLSLSMRGSGTSCAAKDSNVVMYEVRKANPPESCWLNTRCRWACCASRFCASSHALCHTNFGFLLGRPAMTATS
jgi:hypothetical protein